MNSAVYWRNRAKLIMERRDAFEYQLNKLLAKEYAKMATNLKKDLEAIFQEISIEKPGELITYNMLHHYDRYYETLDRINKRLDELGSKEQALIEDYFTALYKDNLRCINESLGDMRIISPEMVDIGNQFDERSIIATIKQAWCDDGLNWSERTWGDIGVLKGNLTSILDQGLSQGLNTNKLARMFREQIQGNLYNSQRIIRTEMTHIQTEVATERYKEVGVDKYQVLSFKDDKTCDICKQLYGKTFLMSEMSVGKNCPPIHPNDRCTIIPIME